MSGVEELKKQGNAAFSAHDYKRAIELYTEAIDLDDQNYTLYSNRSGAYCGSEKYKQAELDARKVISLKPDWVRGHTRLGAALEGPKKWDEAAAADTECVASVSADLANIINEGG